MKPNKTWKTTVLELLHRFFTTSIVAKIRNLLAGKTSSAAGADQENKNKE